ncbi:MAG: nucleotidyltransferase domain-containing protein [Candidatus Hydrogenedentota bacterium]
MMKTLSEIIKRIDLRRERLKDYLADIVQQLKKMGAIKIVLFGSFISGKITPASDLDILVIMPDSKNGKQWLKQVYREIKRDVACDIFVFNSKEYEETKDKNFFLKQITKKGKVLYEKRI